MQDLLLHVCCAPCSTHPLEVLSTEFNVVAFFFNPNIYPPAEYRLREKEAMDYFSAMKIQNIIPPYDRGDWLNHVRMHAENPEGSNRCKLCFEFRLRKTAEIASGMNIGFFSTTLTIGPNKPSHVIFPIGETLAIEHGLIFVARDFKKHDGFKKSCDLSKAAGMYRQNYCGCEYSFRDRRIRNADY
ncbi:epoxyqueuosine reductase QueH [bacterium]|nr:epoxyqueuosine reductase QueH [candidate division CSSED10-310 bacterium]